MAAKASAELVVIDPAAHTPEIDCFNLIARLSPFSATYHLPALFGMESLSAGSAAKKIGGIIILGSRTSVYDHLAWQSSLQKWLQPLLSRSVPLFGLCYGHQLIAHMFGVKVGLMAKGEKQAGMRRVKILPDARLGLLEAQYGDLIVSHREQVEGVPSRMEILAESAAVPCDGLRHLDHPIWTLQAHPEATAAFCQNQAIPYKDAPACFQFGWQLVKRFLAYVEGVERNAGH